MQPAISTYLRLMRLHQRAGIWLLLWPCWWAIMLASKGHPSYFMLGLFAAGAVLMRSAGCIINDIADRKIDAQVERTKTRPIASGEISVQQALALVFILITCAACIAFRLGWVVVMWAMISLVPVVIYPFMKRISWWPQLFLGLTFNWGALMGWAAVRGTVELPAILLYVGGIFWTLGYDTIYAHQDKTDDVKIGVKSTALRLGAHSKKAVSFFYLVAVVCWTLGGWSSNAGMLLFVVLLLAQLQFGWQVCNVDLENPASCRRIFISNIYLGWLIFAGFWAGF